MIDKDSTLESGLFKTENTRLRKLKVFKENASDIPLEKQKHLITLENFIDTLDRPKINLMANRNQL